MWFQSFVIHPEFRSGSADRSANSFGKRVNHVSSINPTSNISRQVSAILVAERRELHPHQCAKLQNAEGHRFLRFVHVRGRRGIVRLYFFTGEHDVNGIARFQGRPETYRCS